MSTLQRVTGKRKDWHPGPAVNLIKTYQCKISNKISPWSKTINYKEPLKVCKTGNLLISPAVLKLPNNALKPG